MKELQNKMQDNNNLSNIFTQISTDNTSIDAVAVVDGSSSIPSQDFDETMKLTIRSIYARLGITGPDNPEKRAALIQFSDTTKEECGLTCDPAVLNEKLNKMVQMKKTTNTKKGLEDAKFLLQNANNPKSKKIIVLLTDGVADNCQEALEEATKIKFVCKFDIIAIGIGNKVKKDEITKIASNFYDFFVEDMTCLRKIFSTEPIIFSKAPNLLLHKRNARSAVLGVASDQQDINEYVLEGTIGDHWVEIGRKTCSNNFTVTSIGERLTPNTEYKFRSFITSKTNIRSKYSNVIETRTWAKHHLDFGEDMNVVQTKVLDLKSKLIDFCLPEILNLFVSTINLIVLGNIGGGKSSFINSVRKVFDLNFASTSGGNVDHVDTDINCYDVRKMLDTLKIWDTMGWDETDYEEQMEYVLKGEFPKKTSMKTQVNQLMDQIVKLKSSSTPLARKMHGVVIVIGPSTIGDEVFMKRLKDFNSLCIKQLLTPYYILSKCDELDPEILVDEKLTCDIFESDEIRTCIKEFCDCTSIHPSRVVPFVNYVNPTDEQDIIRDYIALRVLENLLCSAKGFIERELNAEYDLAREVAKLQNLRLNTTSADTSSINPVRLLNPGQDMATSNCVFVCDYNNQNVIGRVQGMKDNFQSFLFAASKVLKIDVKTVYIVDEDGDNERMKTIEDVKNAYNKNPSRIFACDTL